MKIIFSLTFKDIFFNDKVFKKIRSSYLCLFQNNKTLNIKTKQLNYPVKQKNFSNSIEPKTFLRRDYNFYRKDFFSVSHEYLKENLIKDSDKTNLFFYPHNYYSEEIFNKIDKSFDCELITTQFIYFGKIYIGNDFICFETKEDPREKNKKFDIEIYSKYAFSQRDNDNKTIQQKRVIIFNEDIKEVIRRRSLLMYQSIEIFNKNGKSYFFNFFKTSICEKVYDIFHTLVSKFHFNLLSNENIKQNIKKILLDFRTGEISNYKYLLNLNKLSSRTYNDLTQYPVFPWLILKINKLYELTESDELMNNYDEESQGENTKNNEIYIRDMDYPVSMQRKIKRENEIMKYMEEKSESKFPYHLGTHYSTSSYIYYYLMRINPYGQNFIKLQNYKQENPNRTFLSFRETQLILKSSTDNRELIPDLFCYIDFLCNLNCSFFGIRTNLNIVDDFYILEEYQEEENKINLISTFMEYLYRQRKLLNHISTSRKLYKWVDIIFGKKQLPKNPDERTKSCNIFNKYAYEQNSKLEKKLEKYKNRFNNNEINEKKFKSKFQNAINIMNNFGICPSQILTETNIYEGKKNLNNPNKLNTKRNGSYIYFSKIKNDQYLSIKELSNKGTLPMKSVIIYDNKLDKEKVIFSCGNFETNISKIYMNMGNSFLIHLYKPNYAISQIIISNDLNQNKEEIFILTCRFLGNLFKVQNLDKTIMVLCEDFVTCIVSRNSRENDKIFYTGLKNGKLTSWEIEIKEKSLTKNKKKVENSIFIINEIKHIYDHKSSITAIEINNSKGIIATASEDKFIHIRKLYDFEILTSIDLTYSFGNSIISKNKNIFPSLIKISDINCIYVLLYDYKYKKTKIRGYTLNGLFFAETDENITGVGNNDFSFNNISFNKNWNLIVGVYNYDEILLLNSYNLKVKFQKRLENRKNNHYGNNWIEYNSSTKEFIILYDNECHIKSLIEEEKNKFY